LYGETHGSPFHQRDTLLKDLDSHLKQGKEISLGKNQIRSFIYIGDVIRALKHHIKNLETKPIMYNIAANESLSLVDFAKLYATQFGLDASLIKEIDYKHADKKDVINEPLNNSLNPEKFEKRYNFKFQTAKDGLHEVYERLRTGFTKRWV
jgi:dTDP-4-dehydrorhamnose reductase